MASYWESDTRRVSGGQVSTHGACVLIGVAPLTSLRRRRWFPFSPCPLRAWCAKLQFETTAQMTVSGVDGYARVAAYAPNVSDAAPMSFTSFPAVSTITAARAKEWSGRRHAHVERVLCPCEWVQCPRFSLERFYCVS